MSTPKTTTATTTSTMGMSTDITGVGSLPCQDHMGYVKSENVDRNSNNGINTVEFNFTNTRVENTDNRVTGIQNQENLLSQILSNTNNIRSEQDVHHNNIHQIVTTPHFVETHQTENSPTLLSPESFINSITNSNNNGASTTNFNNNNNNNNLPSPSIIMMWQDDFDFSTLPSYDFCDIKDNKLEEENTQNDEDINPPAMVHLEGHGNGGLADYMENEETFEITHQADGMILTATQEIIANGISTQDFMACQNLDDPDNDFTSCMITDEVQAFNEEDEIELDTDPMMSRNVLHTFIEGFKTEHKLEPPESPIGPIDDIETDAEVDEKATQQLLTLLAYSNNNTKKDATINIISSTPVKKHRGGLQALNVHITPSTSAGTAVDTAQVVDTIFTWENNTINNDDITSPLDISSTSHSARNTPLKDRSSSSFLFEDITQSSQLSLADSRFDCSEFGSTAPPTPFSTVSFDTARSAERKRRGRPPKTHSVEPDPEQLERLSSSQRRYVIQRYKNNEASRQSRLNRKNKQDQLMDEENQQLQKNKRLSAMLAKWEKKEQLLKDMLRQQVKLS